MHMSQGAQRSILAATDLPHQVSCSLHSQLMSAPLLVQGQFGPNCTTFLLAGAPGLPLCLKHHFCALVDFLPDFRNGTDELCMMRCQEAARAHS